MRTSPPPPGRSRTLLGFAAFGLFWGAWGAVLPTVQSGAAVTDGELGLALLCIGAGALVAMRPAGMAVDRWGARALPVAVAAFAVAAVAPALAAGPLALAAALLLLGGTSGAVDVAINAEGVRAEAHTRPVMHLAHAAFSAAVVLCSLATAAARAAGAGAPVVLATTAGLLLAVALTLRLQPAAHGGGPPATAEAGQRSLWRVRPALAVLGGLAALAYFVENAWQSWGAIHLQTGLGAPPGLASLAPAFFAAAVAVGRLIGQGLIARWSERRLLVGGALIAAAGTLVGAGAPTSALALAGIALAGLGTSVCAPTLISLAGRRAAPNERGAAVSSVTTLGYLGFLIGPALVGVAADATSLSIALAGVALVALVLAGLSALARHSTTGRPMPRS